MFQPAMNAENVHSRYNHTVRDHGRAKKIIPHFSPGTTTHGLVGIMPKGPSNMLEKSNIIIVDTRNEQDRLLAARDFLTQAFIKPIDTRLIKLQLDELRTEIFGRPVQRGGAGHVNS